MFKLDYSNYKDEAWLGDPMVSENLPPNPKSFMDLMWGWQLHLFFDEVNIFFHRECI